MVGFPGGSNGEEFACNAGDLASIPGLSTNISQNQGTERRGRSILFLSVIGVDLIGHCLVFSKSTLT